MFDVPVKWRRITGIAGVLASALLMASRAAAQDDEGVAVSGSVAIVSDYRFRGVSLSGGKPALQSGAEIEHRGWFAGGWGSTVGTSREAGFEVDAYVGRRGRAGGFRYSIAGYAYLASPGQPSAVEIQTLAGHRIGRGDLELELSYAPHQRGRPENLYLGMRAALPIADTGLSVVARGGIENGYFKSKLDWEAGFSWSRGPLILSATLVDARQRNSVLNPTPGPAAILSILHTW